MKHLVEPIRSKKDIAAVEAYLAEKNPRNRLIFVFGINSGLRVSDILAVRERLAIRNVSEPFEWRIRQRSRYGSRFSEAEAAENCFIP